MLKPYPSVGMDVLHSLRHMYHSPCPWENSFHQRLNVLKSSCYYIDNIQLNHFNSWRLSLSHEILHTETAKLKPFNQYLGWKKFSEILDKTSIQKIAVNLLCRYISWVTCFFYYNNIKYFSIHIGITRKGRDVCFLAPHPETWTNLWLLSKETFLSLSL